MAEPDSLLSRLRRYQTQLADPDSGVAIMAAANFVVDARDSLPEIIEAFELLDSLAVVAGSLTIEEHVRVVALLSKVSNGPD